MPIGYIQMYPVDSEWKTLYDYEASQNVWGMDQFIGEPAYWEKGIELNLFRQQLHILWRTREQKQSQWTRK